MRLLALLGLLCCPQLTWAESLRVVVAQIENSSDLHRQLRSAEDFLKREDLQAGDLVLFPELALTGFTPAFLSLSSAEIEAQMGVVRDLAREKSVYVFLGLPRYRDGLRFNAYLLVGPNGDILREFDKIGFTSTDEKLFTKGSDFERTVTVGGFTVGVVICTEVQMGLPFNAQFSKADLVVWPGFWGWPSAFDWNSKDPTIAGVRGFQAEFRKPLIQANFSRTPSMPYPEGFVGGGSIYVGADGTILQQLESGAESAGFFEVGKEPSQASSMVLGK